MQEQILAAGNAALQAASEHSDGHRITGYALLHAAAVSMKAHGVDRNHAREWLREATDQMLAEVYPEPEKKARTFVGPIAVYRWLRHGTF